MGGSELPQRAESGHLQQRFAAVERLIFLWSLRVANILIFARIASPAFVALPLRI
jgi:hypothetical protein